MDSYCGRFKYIQNERVTCQNLLLFMSISVVLCNCFITMIKTLSPWKFPCYTFFSYVYVYFLKCLLTFNNVLLNIKKSVNQTKKKKTN